MKKVMFYFVFVILLILILPLIFTEEFKTTEVGKTIPFDYGEYSQIKLLHVQDKSIEEMELDKYLYGVVASEMPASFEVEALKAQSVVARTYTIYQIKNNSKHQDADICDSSLCCQAWITKENRFARWEDGKEIMYWNKIVGAVNDTKGKVIFYDNNPINAFFHSNSGGKTELAKNVWGKDYPYLNVVESLGEDAYTSYSFEHRFSKDNFVKVLKQKYSDIVIDFNLPKVFKINSFTESGRVKEIQIGNKTLTGVEVRNIFGLKSANFTISIIEDDIIFTCLGHGHGVGLSQCGSDVLAKQGKNYEEIIKHYYKDVTIHE